MSQKNKAPCDSPRSNSKKKRYNSTEVVSSASWWHWQMLPDQIFSDILMIVGLQSIKDVQKCKQICQSWNLIVTQMTKLKKDSIRRKAESAAAQIKKKLQWYSLRLPDILTTACLAHHGILGSVECMQLSDLDLASVPAKHLASLASCVTKLVKIFNASNFDIISILSSARCHLYINRQTLNSEETWALVRAMESRVKNVTLGRQVS